MKKLSLIVPCYNEEESIPIFYERIMKVLLDHSYPYEILFIDDGSTDQTLQLIKKIAEKDKCVTYLSFSRNFGKESAMYAGFCNVDGDYVAVMDADLQDPPELLPQMMEIIEKEGYDSVATRRANRAGEPLIRSWFAKLYYKLIRKISDIDIVDGARDFRLMKRNMVDAILAMSEYNRFSKGIFGWIGFKTYWLPYENVERVAGKTKWNFWSLFNYGFEGILNFSQSLLDITSWIGIIMTMIAVFFLFFIVGRKLICGDPVAGWASTICVIIFMGGIQLLCMGVIGKYLSKIYVETKHRPHYIVADSNKEDVVKIN